jgi:long-chain fatty acid transport protein
LVLSSSAHAGGLARPNGISARGTGMGGAWCALADDATAVWFNPAAMADMAPHVLVGGELVLGPRSFTPVADDGTRGDAQKATVVAPVPALGVVGRFDDESWFTLGAGLWNTFGGKVAFEKTGMPALDTTEEVVVEANTGAALRVSDKLAIGGAVRVGLGLFALEATELPFDASLSASGVGIGMTWGALVAPSERVRVAVVWRSRLRITTSGDGTLELAGGPTQEKVEHVQTWPQQAALSVGVAPRDGLRLAAQVDYTQWSAVRELVVAFPSTPALDQTYREDWRDSWTVRAGGDIAVAPAVTVRGGAYLDTAAVPDRTIERQYLDSFKIGLATGASVTHAAWQLDAAVDLVLPNTRAVPNNSVDTASFPADRNKAPGDYRGTLITFELAGAYRF